MNRNIYRSGVDTGLCGKSNRAFRDICGGAGCRMIAVVLGMALALFVGGCGKKSSVGPPVDRPFVRLVEGETLQSKVFGQAVKYSVLLPADYKTSGASYPVVYLLHGYGDNYTAWSKDGNIQLLADNLSSEIVPMIFVMPDGYNSYYINNFNGAYRYQDMLKTEMVPEIDKIYRTKKDPAQRAVMGYSMGGYGALILPALNPDVFRIGVPLSMSFRTDEQYMGEPQGVFNSQWASIYGGTGNAGAARLTPWFVQNSPFHFFDTDNLSAFSGLKLLMDCGDDEESLSVTSGALHNLLRDKHFAHEYRMGNGAHTWSYWYKGIPEGLRFISKNFQGAAYPADPVAVSVGTPIAAEQYVQEELGTSGIQLGVFRPAGYASSTDKYPVIFFINDADDAARTGNAMNMISLLNNAMQGGKIPPAVVVEIPCGTNGVSTAMMNQIVGQIAVNHRIVAGKLGWVLLGHARGGGAAWSLMPDFKEVVNGCFLFDAVLPDHATAEAGAYYYVDATDKAGSYLGNYALYLDLRSKGNGHEYRVRQGTGGFQSAINGVVGSWYYLSRALKNQL